MEIFEWLIDFWRATQNLPSQTPPVDKTTSVADWLAAGGAVGAAFAAAYAAFLSHKAAQQSMSVTLEVERSVVIKDALEAKHQCDSGANQLFYAVRPLKNHIFRKDFTHDQKHWETQIDGYWALFKKHGAECDSIVNMAMSAKGPLELADTKKKLILLQSSIRETKAGGEKAQEDAAAARII